MPEKKLATCLMNLPAIFGHAFSCNYNEHSSVVVSDSGVCYECLMETHGGCVACVLWEIQETVCTWAVMRTSYFGDVCSPSFCACVNPKH